MIPYLIEHYLTNGKYKDPYIDWLNRLLDKRAKVAIARRVARIEQGNFGDHKFCGEGIWELRIDIGPGYRVYYAFSGQRMVILLGGGDKRTQNADIKLAIGYWQDWQRRKDDEKQAP
jgi:putative addiction module killer protein